MVPQTDNSDPRRVPRYDIMDMFHQILLEAIQPARFNQDSDCWDLPPLTSRFSMTQFQILGGGYLNNA